MVLGIKIADFDGNLPTIKTHILPRYAFTIFVTSIPIIGDGIILINYLLIFSKSRRCIHDHIGKTIVIIK